LSRKYSTPVEIASKKLKIFEKNLSTPVFGPKNAENKKFFIFLFLGLTTCTNVRYYDCTFVKGDLYDKKETTESKPGRNGNPQINLAA
jgi:hypothetical protein